MSCTLTLTLYCGSWILSLLTDIPYNTLHISNHSQTRHSVFHTTAVRGHPSILPFLSLHVSSCEGNKFCGCYVYDSLWFLLSFIEFYSIIIKFIYSPSLLVAATTTWRRLPVSIWLGGCYLWSGTSYMAKNNILLLLLSQSFSHFLSYMSNKFIDISIYLCNGSQLLIITICPSLVGCQPVSTSYGPCVGVKHLLPDQIHSIHFSTSPWPTRHWSYQDGSKVLAFCH